jgi:hypothetical protein
MSYDLSFLGNQTVEGALVGLNDQLTGFQNLGGFSVLILGFLWFIIFGVGMFANKRSTGYANVAVWGSIAGITTTTSAFILYLIPNAISLSGVILFLCITCLFVLWLLFHDENT